MINQTKTVFGFSGEYLVEQFFIEQKFSRNIKEIKLLTAFSLEGLKRLMLKSPTSTILVQTVHSFHLRTRNLLNIKKNIFLWDISMINSFNFYNKLFFTS